jgi:hypothetical protein
MLRAQVVLAAGLLVCAAAPAPAQWFNYAAPGIPRTPDGKPNLSAPAPKMYDGKPDLSGVGAGDPDYFRDLAKDLKPGDVQMLPWAEQLQKERETNDHKDGPLAHCMRRQETCQIE